MYATKKTAVQITTLNSWHVISYNELYFCPVVAWQKRYIWISVVSPSVPVHSTTEKGFFLSSENNKELSGDILSIKCTLHYTGIWYNHTPAVFKSFEACQYNKFLLKRTDNSTDLTCHLQGGSKLCAINDRGALRYQYK